MAQPPLLRKEGKQTHLKNHTSEMPKHATRAADAGSRESAITTALRQNFTINAVTKAESFFLTVALGGLFL